MTTIFIPLIFICINNNCEFMQGIQYYETEEQCLVSVAEQKDHMQNLVNQAGQGKIQLLEGTCVDLDVKVIKLQSTGEKL